MPAVSQEHLGPILGFGAAGAGLDGEDGVGVVGFAGEQHGSLKRGGIFFRSVEFAGDFGDQGFALRGVGFFGG
jgi:hypothetical protein